MSAIVLFSAGLDSAATSFFACGQHSVVDLLYISYGSRQEKAELLASESYLSWLRASFPQHAISFRVLKTPTVFGTSGLTDAEVVLNKTSDVEVKGRNLMFLAMANTLALRLGYQSIYMGANQGAGGNVHPDASSAFLEAAGRAVAHGSEGAVSLQLPFLYKDKRGVWEYIQEQEIPAGLTYSCYSGAGHCGVCDACVVRRTEAQAVGITDPVPYTV